MGESKRNHPFIMPQPSPQPSASAQPAPIRVKVLAPALISHDRFDKDGYVHLSDGDTLGSLLKLLKAPLPLRFSHFLRVNYERVPLSTKLHDGDVVTFLFPLSGG